LAVSSLSDKQFKLLFASWWIIWATMQMITLLDIGLTPAKAFADSIISNVLLAACCLLINNNMRFYLPRQEKYWYILIVSLGLSLIWLIAVRIVVWLLFKKDEAYMAIFYSSMSIRYCTAFLLVGCMALLSLLWYTQQEQKENDARKVDAERMSRDAELYKLRQQLQPHFLFNSLNSISALTGSQPDKARHMIQQLSDFLRGTLKKDEQQWSSLEEELEYLQLYLDIEKVRFGYRLQTELIHDEKVLQMKLPSMLLQPVVENAIKFGLYDTIGEVMITLTATAVNNHLEISVKNPFDIETSQPLQGTGFGLASIKRRLFLLFARHDLLQTRTEENYFITTIMIPQTI